MATNFPASLDTLTNPTSSDSLSSPSHSAQHANVNDAVEALQAKVGADSSAVTSSHDYLIADHASRITTLEGRDTAGLVHISRTTIGSAVSSVTVSGAFSTDYDSYKIIVQGGAASTAVVNLQFTLGATTTGYSHAALFNSYTTSAGASALVNGAFWNVGGGSTTTLSMNMDIHGPFATEYTTFDSAWTRTDAIGFDGGYLNNTTSYTAFTITTSTGTMTGGTIDVYGYAKA